MAQKPLTQPTPALNGHCLDLSIPVRSSVCSALFSASYLWCGWTRPSLGGTLPFLLFSPRWVTWRVCFGTSDEIVACISWVVLSHGRMQVNWEGRRGGLLWARGEEQSLLVPDYYPLSAYDKWKGFRFLSFQRRHMLCSAFSSVTMTLARRSCRCISLISFRYGQNYEIVSSAENTLEVENSETNNCILK